MLTKPSPELSFPPPVPVQSLPHFSYLSNTPPLGTSFSSFLQVVAGDFAAVKCLALRPQISPLFSPFYLAVSQATSLNPALQVESCLSPAIAGSTCLCFIRGLRVLPSEAPQPPAMGGFSGQETLSSTRAGLCPVPLPLTCLFYDACMKFSLELVFTGQGGM